MADRTVTTRLVADTSAYTPKTLEASKSMSALSAAEKEAAAAAKAATAEQRTQAAAAREAAAQQAAAQKEVTTARAEAAAAAKAAAEAETAASRAVTDSDRAEAASAQEAAQARQMAADEALASAQATATAAAESASASKTAAAAAAADATAKRNVASAAKDAAGEETAAAAAAEAAAKKRSDAYTHTGKVVSGLGLGLVAAFGAAELATSSFDKSMSGVAAVASATAPEMDQLRTAALNAGRDTAFSATQAADAEGELVKAGVSVKDVLGGALMGSLSLAAAGQLDLADAATISANAMNTFGLHGSDVSHIADVLAAAANKSAADVKELAYGMQQGGLVAAQTGLSFEETSAVLAAFADRGLKGADAGTSLKTMLEKLNAPTTQAADEMKNLGITTYDSSGKFVGITTIAGELHDRLGDLTAQQRNQALATIFGSDAIRAASVLYNLGADGVKGYTDAVNDQGAAGRMAAEQMNNLSGDVEQLKGSLETALIKGGSGANAVLRDMAQYATKAVNAFAALPKPVQEAAVGFSGGAGMALLMVGGLTSLAGKAASTKKTLSEVAEASKGMKGALASAGSFMAGPWGLAIAGAATVIGIFASKHNDAKVAVNSFTDAIKDDGNAIGTATTNAVAADLANKGLYASFQKLGIGSTTVTNAALGNKDALKQLTDATMAAIEASTKHGAAGMKAAVGLGSSLAQVRAYRGALDDQLKAQQQATAATENSTAATGTSAAETQKAEQAAKNAAAATYAQAAGQRALAEAHIAAADTTKQDTEATVAHGKAHVSTTGATNAASAAAKAHTTAAKADANAQKDSAKAAADHSKANDAAAKSSSAAANAEKINADANATAAEKKKANSTASRDAAAAARSQTTADNASARALDAATAAAEKKAAASDKTAKAAQKAADAAAKQDKAQAQADADAAKAQADAAEADREAALVHQVGVKWLQAVAEAEAQASGSARDLDASVTAEVGAMKDAKDKASSLKDAMDALNGVHIAASKAAIDVQQKIADLTKSLHDNGNQLDITTEKGRANMTAIDDLASAASAHAQAVAEESGSIDAGNKALDASRAEFDAVLKSAGFSTNQIDQFNKTLLNTPKLAPVTVTANTAEFEAKMKALADRFGYISVQVGGGSGGRAAFAAGGLVTGVGTTTSDSNMIAVSNKEYIVNAAAVARPGMLDHLNAINFGAGNATVVKPQIPLHSLPTPAASPSSGSGAALHIENYFENGAPPQQVAAELGWLAKSRGSAW